MKEIKTNEDGAFPCKYCQKHKKIVYPRIVEITSDDLFYAQCPNCRHYDLYDFLGATKKAAVKIWNNAMSGRGNVYDE